MGTFSKKELTELNKYKDITFVFWGPQAEHLCDMLEMKNQLNVICSIHPDKVTSTTNVGIFSTKDPTYGTLVKKFRIILNNSGGFSISNIVVNISV